jgi:hypothetical protein
MKTEVHLWSLALIGQHNGVFSMKYGLRPKKQLMMTQPNTMDVNAEYRRFRYIDCKYPRRRYRSFATTVSQLKIYDFSGETFKGLEVL